MKRVRYGLFWLCCLWCAVATGQSFTTSNLPILIFDTKGQTIVDDPKVVTALSVIDNGPGKRNAVTDRPTFATKIGVELRGSSSQVLFPKKSYGFEMRDTSGLKQVDASMLGLPSGSDWVLNATYSDKTLIRETLTYDLYRQMSPYYASRYRYCEVVLNGAYQGVYILFEKIKRDKNRVNIASIKKGDVSGTALTGGYILKIDKTTGSASRLWVSPYPAADGRSKSTIQIDRPKPEDLAEEQFQYIKKYVTDAEASLQSTQYQDSTTGYRKYLDVNSFVDYLLLTEVCRNVDGYRLSAYLYKDRDSSPTVAGKLVMGPIWDYNLTYGNADYCQGDQYSGWAYQYGTYCPNDTFQIPFWWGRLLSDRAFAKQVRVKYQALRQTVLKTDRIHAYIDSTALLLTEARTRNFQRWPVIGVYVWPNSYVGQTYQQEIDFLKMWVERRLQWLDAAFVPFGEVVSAVDELNPQELTISPNPSAGDLTVRYQLNNRSIVQLTVLDASGRTVHSVAYPDQSAGEHTNLLSGMPTAPGVYFVQLLANGQSVACRKILRQ